MHKGLFWNSRRADENKGLSAEWRHFFDGLIQKNLGHVKVQVFAHHITIFALLFPALNKINTWKFSCNNNSIYYLPVYEQVILKISQNKYIINQKDGDTLYLKCFLRQVRSKIFVCWRHPVWRSIFSSLPSLARALILAFLCNWLFSLATNLDPTSWQSVNDKWNKLLLKKQIQKSSSSTFFSTNNFPQKLPQKTAPKL